MEIIFDVLKFLNKIDGAFYLTIEDDENLIRLKEVLTSLFQNVNSKKLENVLENVRQIDILIRAGDSNEVPDVVKILCEDVKDFYKEYRIKKYKMKYNELNKKSNNCTRKRFYN